MPDYTYLEQQVPGLTQRDRGPFALCHSILERASWLPGENYEQECIDICSEQDAPDGIANKIIFTRHYPGNEFLSFLIVEGETDKKTLNLNVQSLLQTVKNKSQKQNITDAQLKASIQDVKKDTYDFWHICCGHDLVCILSIGLRNALGTCNANDVKPDILERSLRLAFEHPYFYTTQLCASIRQWEKDNKPFMILLQ